MLKTFCATHSTSIAMHGFCCWMNELRTYLHGSTYTAVPTHNIISFQALNGYLFLLLKIMHRAHRPQTKWKHLNWRLLRSNIDWKKTTPSHWIHSAALQKWCTRIPFQMVNIINRDFFAISHWICRPFLRPNAYVTYQFRKFNEPNGKYVRKKYIKLKWSGDSPRWQNTHRTTVRWILISIVLPSH